MVGHFPAWLASASTLNSRLRPYYLGLSNVLQDNKRLENPDERRLSTTRADCKLEFEMHPAHATMHGITAPENTLLK